MAREASTSLANKAGRAACIILPVLMLAIASPACNSADRKTRRPVSTVAPGQNASQCPKPAEAPSSMSRLNYQVAVIGPLHMAACDKSADCVHDTTVQKLATGDVVLDTMSDFSIKFVSGQLVANIALIPGTPGIQIPIDITKALGQFSPEATQCDPRGNLSTDADGRILMTNRLGNIQFDPPRPLLLGPVIQDPADFEGLQRAYPNIHYSSAPGSTGAPVDGYAGLLLRVINTRLPLKVQYEPKPVEVLHWEMVLDPNTRSSAQSMEALLPKRLAFYWRTRPIQIPRLVIETSLSSLIGGSLLGGGANGGAASGGGGFGDLLGNFGVVRIILDAKSIEAQ